MTTTRGIPGSVSALVRDVARMLREQQSLEEHESIFDDLVMEGGLEFAIETSKKARAFNTERYGS